MSKVVKSYSLDPRIIKAVKMASKKSKETESMLVNNILMSVLKIQPTKKVEVK